MTQVITARGQSIADAIEARLSGATTTIDVAVYRFDNARLARALDAGQRRGVRIRLVLDERRYAETPATRELLARYPLPHRLALGRRGRGSKMHHKFAVLDDHAVITGSYNWTDASESEHWENIVIVSAPDAVAAYRHEFDALWADAPEPSGA